MSSTNRMALPKLSIGSTLTFLLLVIVSCANVNGALPQANNLIIYDNSLAPGWEDWSWDSTINFDATNQTHSASKAIAITHTVGNGGFSIRNGSPIDTSGYKSLDFWIYGNGEPLTIYTQSTDNGGRGNALNLTPTDWPWKEVSSPLTT